MGSNPWSRDERSVCAMRRTILKNNPPPYIYIYIYIYINKYIYTQGSTEKFIGWPRYSCGVWPNEFFIFQNFLTPHIFHKIVFQFLYVMLFTKHCVAWNASLRLFTVPVNLSSLSFQNWTGSLSLNFKDLMVTCVFGIIRL